MLVKKLKAAIKKKQGSLLHIYYHQKITIISTNAYFSYALVLLMHFNIMCVFLSASSLQQKLSVPLKSTKSFNFSFLVCLLLLFLYPLISRTKTFLLSGGSNDYIDSNNFNFKAHLDHSSLYLYLTELNLPLGHQ